jgi:hypothetical protein
MIATLAGGTIAPSPATISKSRDAGLLNPLRSTSVRLEPRVVDLLGIGEHSAGSVRRARSLVSAAPETQCSRV